jgi:hypothetical protein
LGDCKIVSTGFAGCVVCQHNQPDTSKLGDRQRPDKAAAVQEALAQCDPKLGRCVVTYFHCAV